MFVSKLCKYVKIQMTDKTMCGVRDLLPRSCISDGLALIFVPVLSGGRVMRVFRTRPLCALPSDNKVCVLSTEAQWSVPLER
jgi:hypothetical protein